MVRIAGGMLRGRRLLTPEGEVARPTTDRVREALFNMARGVLLGARVLDLYAGSAALGMEALSRGAERVWFVENDPGCLDIVRENIIRCGMEAHADALAGSALDPAIYRQLAALNGESGASGITLVLLDPPYRKGMVPETLDLLGRCGILASGALAVAEHEAELVVSSMGRAASGVPGGYWRWQQSRRYGQTTLTFWKWLVAGFSDSLS